MCGPRPGVPGTAPADPGNGRETIQRSTHAARNHLIQHSGGPARAPSTAAGVKSSLDRAPRPLGRQHVSHRGPQPRTVGNRESCHKRVLSRRDSVCGYCTYHHRRRRDSPFVIGPETQRAPGTLGSLPVHPRGLTDPALEGLHGVWPRHAGCTSRQWALTAATHWMRYSAPKRRPPPHWLRCAQGGRGAAFCALESNRRRWGPGARTASQGTHRTRRTPQKLRGF